MLVNSSFYDTPLWLMSLFFLLFLFLRRLDLKIGEIIVLSLILRLAAALIFPVPPSSDYLKYHEAATALANGGCVDTQYFGAFPHALGYSFLISRIYRIFGANEKIIYIINAFTGVFSVFLVYANGILLFKDKKSASCAAFVYGIFPSSVFYTSLLSTEIPHTMLYLAAIYTALKEKKVKNALAVGALAALMNFIRPTGIIFFTAYALYIIFYGEDLPKSRLLRFFSALIAYILIMGAGNIYLSSVLDKKLPAAPVGYNLYVGMNKEALGRWNEKDYELAMSMADNPEKMHRLLGAEAWERFKANGIAGNLKLFAEKFALTWGSDTAICQFMNGNSLFNSMNVYFICLCQGFRLFVAFYCIPAAFGRKSDKRFMLLMLSVLGFAALHLVTETMERYIYIPIITIILMSGTVRKGNYAMLKNLMADINAVLERDPASTSRISVFLLSPGVKALSMHRCANFFWRHNMKFIANAISMRARRKTGIEIHPGAKIGKGVLIDHGMGVVIGETAVVGDGCTIYQNVTLGGTGKDTGKRHPTIGNNVLIGAGAKVLGPFTVGDNSKIAANAVVLSEVPPESTCVGVPARVVKQNNKKIHDCQWQLDQTHIPDPISQELCKLNMRIDNLERKEK